MPPHTGAGEEDSDDADKPSLAVGKVAGEDGIHEADEGKHDGAVETLVDVDEVGPVVLGGGRHCRGLGEYYIHGVGQICKGGVMCVYKSVVYCQQMSDSAHTDATAKETKTQDPAPEQGKEMTNILSHIKNLEVTKQDLEKALKEANELSLWEPGPLQLGNRERAQGHPIGRERYAHLGSGNNGGGERGVMVK